MIKEVTLPEISENVESGDVIEIVVKVGDMVQKEQSLAVLETEKATFEVPSPDAGKIIEISISQGDNVKVGQVIAKIDTEGKAEEKPSPPPVQAPEKEPASQEKKSESAKEPTLRQSPQRQKKSDIQPDQEKPKSQDISVGEKKPEAPEKTAEVAPAAPSVRQFARELGIDIALVTGTASGGRITLDDVKQYARQAIASGGKQPVSAPAQQTKPLPDFTKWGQVERQKATVTRKKIAEILSFTWSTVPQVTQFDQADITLLEEFRREYGDEVKQAGGKLTMTSILLKAVTMALQEFPNFNTSYDPDTQEIIYKKYYHVSVAVDTDRGLLVPVIQNVDQKSLLELSVELSELADKARQHKVTPDEMVGGNFTITNLGGIGGTGFSPIIYWPQTAILGIARAAKQPVYTDDAFEPRLIAPLSLSYDHRIIDGAEGIRFLRYIIHLLEKPFLLAVHDSNK